MVNHLQNPIHIKCKHSTSDLSFFDGYNNPEACVQAYMTIHDSCDHH